MTDVPYRRSPDVDLSMVGERAILFERATKRALVLNPTGAQIWQLLETPRSPSQLSEALQERFSGVPAAQISGDVEIYLQQLLDQKLVVTA